MIGHGAEVEARTGVESKHWPCTSALCKLAIAGASGLEHGRRWRSDGGLIERGAARLSGKGPDDVA